MTKTIFLHLRTAIINSLLSIKVAYLSIVILSFSSSCYVLAEQPISFQDALKKADQLNDKNPAIALEFTQDLLITHTNLEPRAKAAILARLAEYNYFLGNLDKSLKRVNQFYALIPNLGSSDSISVLLTHGGVLDTQGKSEQAMELFLQAEQLAKDSENKELLAESYGSIASSFTANHNDSEALKYYHQAYLLIKELGDDLEMAYLKIQMASSYSYLHDNEKAISLANEAISYFNHHEFYFDELFAQSTLARIFITMKEYDKAIQVYKRVIELSQQVENESLITVAYLGLAKAYHRKDKHSEGRKYFSLYQKFPPASNTPFSLIDELVLNASIAFAEKNIILAKDSIKQAEETLSALNEESMLSWHVTILDFKAELAVFEQDYEAAYHLQKEARKLFKSYQNNEREKVRSKYKIMFDTDQALLKNQLLERDKQLDQASLENAAQKQKLQTILISIISFFALILLFFIIRQLKTSKILHRLANTDTLTELANRRYTFIYAEEMLSLVKKNEQNFAIIIFDVDHFKQVNDTYGHAGGDIALKNIAAIANEYVRGDDILGRIGGEEFLLVLPNTSAIQAMEVAERIRLGIYQEEIMIAEQSVTISASFGVAELNKKQQNFNQIFHEADIALYQAKNAGRNRIIMAS